MKKFHILLIVLSLFSCQSKPDFRIIPFPENQHYNFPRLVAGSEKWFVYPYEKNLLFYSSLDFSTPHDTLKIHDSLWDDFMNIWKLELVKKGDSVNNISKPTGYVGERWPDIQIDGIELVGDSLIFCYMKFNYLVKMEEGSSMRAIYPLVCFDLKTKQIIKEYSVVHAIDYSKGTFTRGTTLTPKILIGDNDILYLSQGKKYDSTGKSLEFNNKLYKTSVLTGGFSLFIEIDSVPIVLSHDKENVFIGAGNKVLRYNYQGELQETIETGLKPGLRITGYTKTKSGEYFIVYETRTEPFVEVYKKGVKEPLFSAPYESASYNFQYWNGHYYFFYDQDAVTYAIEFD